MLEWIKHNEEKHNQFRYKRIRQADIEFDPVLRVYCERNHCGMYGKNWMYPPGLGSTEELSDRLKSYGSGIVIQLIYVLKGPNSIDEWLKAIDILNGELRMQNTQLSKYIPKEELFMLGIGPCTFCNVCSIEDDKPCLYPNNAMSSVEAYNIKVNPILEAVGLKRDNGENTISLVGIILSKIKLEEK